MGGDRNKAQSSFLKPLKGCTFLPCKKHVEDDISRKIADLGLPSIKREILDDIFGSEQKKEKGIIDSESAEEFMVKVESVYQMGQAGDRNPGETGTILEVFPEAH